MYFKTDKNKNYIKNCETIIKQNGSCDGFSCENCPIINWGDGGKYCIDGNGENEYDAHLEGAKEYLNLTKGEKYMIKGDLKNGMVVGLRNGDKRLVLYSKLLRLDGYDIISSYNNDLKHINNSDYDIMYVYNSHAYSINEIFKSLTLIWERKSEAEIKLKEIQKQIEELSKSAEELRKEIKTK